MPSPITIAASPVRPQQTVILSSHFGGKTLCRRWKSAIEHALKHQHQTGGGQKVAHCAGADGIGFCALVPFTSRKKLKNSEFGDRTIDVPDPCSDAV